MTYESCFRVLITALAVATLSFAGCFNSGPSDNRKISAGEAKLISKVGLKYDKLHWFLTKDERPALEAVHDKYKAELKEWYSENGEAVAKVGKALVNFVTTKNKSKARKAIKQAKKDDTQKLIRERDRIIKEYEAEVIASVPLDKFELWQADKISRTLLEFLTPLGLTEEQQNQIRQLAPDALKQVKESDKNIWLVKGTSRLETMVGRQVLTQAQKPQFEKLKTDSKLRKLKWAW